MSLVRWYPEKIEGRHVLAGLLGFFAVILIANGFFLFYALSTFNGFETDDAYRRGLAYNDRIASEREQEVRGWQPALRYETDRKRLVLQVNDRSGNPVRGLTVSGQVRHPVNDKADRALEFQEVAPATYAVSLDLSPGQWTVAAAMFERHDRERAAHRLKQRLWVEGRQ